MGQSEQDSLLRQVSMMIQDGRASQRMLASEVATLSRVARESQKEAQTAQKALFKVSLIVVGLRSRIAELERERDELLDRLAENAKLGAGVAELRGQLADAQQKVHDFSELHTQGQRELTETQQRLQEAERLADEAVSQLAQYERARRPGEDDHEQADESRPDLNDYERALDDLVDERKSHGERIRGIERELRGRALPAPAGPVALPGAEKLPGPEKTPHRNAGASHRASATGYGAWKSYGSITGSIAGLAIVVGLLVIGVFGPIQMMRDDSYFLGSLQMAGSKPTAAEYASTCYYVCSGTVSEDLTYSLRAGQDANTTFQVSDTKNRYLNVVSFSLVNVSRACGSSPSVSYWIYSDGHLVSSGTVTTKNFLSLSDRPIGKHARVRFTARLDAPKGCSLSLDIGNASVDALKGGSAYV
jgi:hypothetical protein